MKNSWIERILTTLVVVFVITGCVPFLGGNPSLPLADKNGTVRVFAATETETTTAINSAFANHRYREMSLYSAIGQDYLASGWHPTNGFVLEPILSLYGTITNISVGALTKRSLPYKAYFHIVTTPDGPRETKVTVRTILAEVIDGKEPGVHGGWAHHFRKVPPVRQEEENVLAAIAEQLDSEGKSAR